MSPARMDVLEPVQTFWRIKGPSGRVITCAAYRGIPLGSVEIRIGYTFDTTLVLELASDLVLASQRASQLLETLQEKDGYEIIAYDRWPL